MRTHRRHAPCSAANMRKSCLAFVALLLAFLLLRCSSKSNCERQGTPTLVHNSAIGDTCSNDADCSAGLSCMPAFGGGSPLAGNVCSVDCARVSCPSGTACIDLGSGRNLPDGGTAEATVCLQSCATDADCLRGTRAGSCTSSSDGGSPICRPLACSDPSGAGQGRTPPCPAGYACKEFPVGCGSDQGGAPTLGWCERTP